MLRDAPPPLVSIVIPAYNREATVQTAIESVLRQTFTDFEIVVVDDCSIDATIARASAVPDPRIRVVSHDRNRGASAARNTGIRAARGRWVAFQDSDDEWLPLKLEKQMERLAAPGADFVAAYCGMMVLGLPESRRNDTRTRPALEYVPYRHIDLVEGDILPTLLECNVVSTQTLVARHDALEKIGGFDETFRALNDWDCVLRLAQVGSFACVDEPLVVQRFSPNSITGNDHGRADAYARLVEKHYDLLAAHPRILANHYSVVARFNRRIGNSRTARAAIAKARALRPLEMRFWTTSARMAMRGPARRGPA